jgi:hypothetical protein
MRAWKRTHPAWRRFPWRPFGVSRDGGIGPWEVDRDYAACKLRRHHLINTTFKPAYLNSLMTAGANLELAYNDLAPHANDRMTAALELAKHAKETQRHIKFVAISAGTSGIKHLAEEGAGYVTFSLVY